MNSDNNTKDTSPEESKSRLDEFAQEDAVIDHSFEFLDYQHPSVRSQTMDANAVTPGDEANESIQDVDKSTNVSGASARDEMKKTRSFLSRLNLSTQDREGVAITSSLANAFSSISTFTTNLTSNSPSANGALSTSASGNSLTIETASLASQPSSNAETRIDVFHKKVAVERKNLIGLTKLIVKDLISTSISSHRSFNDETDTNKNIHLNNYFTLIDRVLKHGLKLNMLSGKSSSLWSALDSLPKYLKESTLMSESVRSLSNTKTADGKIKAWVRLAMIQKKLPEYFNQLLLNKDVLLKDIYHEHAFMLNDEAHVFIGLIIGVNVIDCNFFAKNANFDIMDDVIDLSPYLRAANSYDCDDASEERRSSADEAEIKCVLDQKSYLEERNHKLETTISELQAKLKSLNDQNGKLEMESNLKEVRIAKLMDANRADASASVISGALKNLLGSGDSTRSTTPATDVTPSSRIGTDEQIEGPKSDANEQLNEPASAERLASAQSDDGKAAQKLQEQRLIKSQERIVELEKELHNLKERTSILEASYRGSLDRIRTLERDLDVQTSMNSDKENTIKIFEKDIREKQAQVEQLRSALADARKLNADINERFTDMSGKLKERIKTVSSLQTALDKWKIENKALATRLQDKQAALQSVTKQLEETQKLFEELKRYTEKVKDELRKERESGLTSSETVESQNNKISELKTKVEDLEAELKDVKPYKAEFDALRKRCAEYEQSLEEIGAQLRESRLEVESLKENSAVFLDSQWMDSKQVKNCALCEQAFSVTRRKHHCRLCGNVFCQTCSDNKMELASSSKPVRVCDTCHAFLLAKFVKSSQATANRQDSLKSFTSSQNSQ